MSFNNQNSSKDEDFDIFSQPTLSRSKYFKYNIFLFASLIIDYALVGGLHLIGADDLAMFTMVVLIFLNLGMFFAISHKRLRDAGKDINFAWGVFLLIPYINFFALITLLILPSKEKFSLKEDFTVGDFYPKRDKDDVSFTEDDFLIGTQNGVSGIDLVKMREVMNERIQKINNRKPIGAYMFKDVDNLAKLASVFESVVINELMKHLNKDQLMYVLNEDKKDLLDRFVIVDSNDAVVDMVFGSSEKSGLSFNRKALYRTGFYVGIY